ncbi:MAG: hypothetical protein ACKVUS_12900 [Saprospiraceae bacterium]
MLTKHPARTVIFGGFARFFSPRPFRADKLVEENLDNEAMYADAFARMVFVSA